MRSSESFANIIGNVLRYGVMLSAAIIVVGVVLLLAASGSADATPLLSYGSKQAPSLGGFLSGLASYQPYAVIELGALVLLATPVARVLISVFLFAAQKDRLYVLITAVVLALLLFSMLVTPFIPLFQG
jgi:uncharacterized membrane protein